MRATPALCVVLAACSELQVLQLRPDGAQSVVLATEGPGGLQLDAYAVPLERPHIPVSLEDGRVIYALLYAQRLPELGLAEGPLVPGSGSDRIPPPERALESRDGERWSELPALPEVLAEVRLERALCPSFDSRSYFVPGGALSPSFALSVGPGRGLLYAGGRPFWIDANEARPASGFPADLGPSAAWYDPAHDELWLLGSGGRLMHGHPERGFIEATPLPDPRAYVWMDGPRAGAALELYTITSSTSVHRFDGVRWTHLGQLGPGPALDRGRIAWVEPGWAIALGLGQDDVLESHGGPLRQVHVDGLDIATLPDAVSTVAGTARWGGLVGTDRGRLIRRTANGFEPVATSGAQGQVYVITELDEWLLFGGEDGVLTAVHPEKLCEPFNIGGDADNPLRALVPLAGALLAVPKIPTEAGLRISVLSRVLRPGER